MILINDSYHDQLTSLKSRSGQQTLNADDSIGILKQYMITL